MDGNGVFEFLVKKSNGDRGDYRYQNPPEVPEDVCSPDADGKCHEWLYAYNRDGSLKWQYQYGLGIEMGFWYAPVSAIDTDGDGKDEIYTKDASDDSNEYPGEINHGAEWLTKLDPITGKVLKTAAWPPRMDYNYNNYFRQQITAAYLDGYDKPPSVVVVRGNFESIGIWAYDKDLNIRWKWTAYSMAAGGAQDAYAGLGTVDSVVAVDLDGDLREDIMYGAAAISSMGQPLWRTQDASDGGAVGELHFRNDGIEIYKGSQGCEGCFLETGIIKENGNWLWVKEHALEHIGLVAYLNQNYVEPKDDPIAQKGFVIYGKHQPELIPAGAAEDWFLYDADGNTIPNNYDIPTITQLPLAAWWDGTQFMSVLHGLGGIPDKVNNTMIADFDGDWKEEIIWGREGKITIHRSEACPPDLNIPTLRGDKFYYKMLTARNGYYSRPTILTHIEQLALSPAGRIAKMESLDCLGQPVPTQNFPPIKKVAPPPVNNPPPPIPTPSRGGTCS